MLTDEQLAAIRARFAEPGYQAHRDDVCRENGRCWYPEEHQVADDIDALLAEVERLRLRVPAPVPMLRCCGGAIRSEYGDGGRRHDWPDHLPDCARLLSPP